MADSLARSSPVVDVVEEVDFLSTIHVGDFVGLCTSVLEEDDVSLEKKKVSNEDLAMAMGTETETVNELARVCHLDSLYCASEDKLVVPIKMVNITENIPEGGEGLYTLVSRKHMLERRSRIQRKYNPYSWDLEHQHMSNIPDEQSILKQPEAVLSLVTFHPVIKNSRVVINTEILVLGPQYLTELRDKILCVSDLSVAGEFSETPMLAQDNRAKDVFKSSFFFIENVFYNDMRDETCTDLSEPIRDWLNDRGFSGPKYSIKKMEECTFNDIDIKIGKPYVYCHQGDCEHVIVFADLRLLHPDDCHDISQYPLVIRKLHQKRLLCRVCQLFTSKWMTTEDRLAPEDPCFFCDKCFHMLHYDKDGHKLGDFLAHPFVDKGVFS
ncbi:snRNA-activating protein complex subunit 3-like [Saccoglossus kowalevskii]|uniref:snRNA-activating protein complex subunit 3 n=1 Tax=Saccoglossus kowalevskii TaxID=10224 RepID=A0ABM0LV89_SACKO|nr:PREDICTED: snRNA-activating protein complex subunit 3-like [Saccoglossus kowalevskii]